MSVPESSLSDNGGSEADREVELAQIREALRGLRFGAVNVIVQDGVVVQIDRTASGGRKRSKYTGRPDGGRPMAIENHRC
jgi:hypothetical protein